MLSTGWLRRGRKKRYHRAGTKAAERESESDNFSYLLSVWWNQIQMSGEIFKDPDLYEEGVDYIGALPIPKWVSTKALRHEFVKRTGVEISHARFIARVKGHTAMRIEKTKRGTEKTHYGRIHSFYCRTYFCTDPLTRGLTRDKVVLHRAAAHDSSQEN